VGIAEHPAKNDNSMVESVVATAAEKTARGRRSPRRPTG